MQQIPGITCSPFLLANSKNISSAKIMATKNIPFMWQPWPDSLNIHSNLLMYTAKKMLELTLHCLTPFLTVNLAENLPHHLTSHCWLLYMNRMSLRTMWSTFLSISVLNSSPHSTMSKAFGMSMAARYTSVPLRRLWSTTLVSDHVHIVVLCSFCLIGKLHC